MMVLLHVQFCIWLIAHGSCIDIVSLPHGVIGMVHMACQVIDVSVVMQRMGPASECLQDDDSGPVCALSHTF